MLPVVQFDHVVLDIGPANTRVALDPHVVAQRQHHFLDLREKKEEYPHIIWPKKKTPTLYGQKKKKPTLYGQRSLLLTRKNWNIEPFKMEIPYLLSQLASGRQHHCLALRIGQVNVLQDANGERGSFTGTGLGLRNHVASCQKNPMKTQTSTPSSTA